MFKALDKVHYESLQLNKAREKPKPGVFKVTPLEDQACVTLNWNVPLLKDGLSSLPVHLIPKLLHKAIINHQLWALSTIIANWPLPTLRFADILLEDEGDLLEDEMLFYYYVLDGLTGRTKHCRLSCLDFRGIAPNHALCELIVKLWPLLSLRKAHLKATHLSKIVEKHSGVVPGRLTGSILPKVIKERIDQDILLAKRINLPRGQRLEVKLDCLYFSTDNNFFLDYFICNGLRSMTPLYITVSSLYIKSDLVEGDMITDCLGPFLVLKGQDTQGLDGLSLHQLEEGIFFVISPDIEKYRDLQSLDMQDCNIYLQEGITRSRTLARSQLVKTFQCFNHLHRLDLSFNYLVGCLGEILEGLQQPLDYLSVRGCDLNENDLTSLANSKHAAHLRELNLSKLHQFSVFENDRIVPSCLLKIIKRFPKMVILNLSQNHLPISGIPELCQTLEKDLQHLKGLDVAGNILSFDMQLEIVRACARIPSMQWLRLTCVNNMFQDGGLLLANNQLGEMSRRFRELLKSLGRDDICLDIVRLSFAILVDLIDIMD